MAIPEPKPFASLGPTLLARKGGAKPAMRPQLATAALEPQEFAQDLEDLGWNDMGEDDEPRRETAVLALTPSPHPHEHDAAASEEPEVLRQQRVIAETIGVQEADEDEDADEDFEVIEEPIAPRAPVLDGRRAAFTLRLDAQRHLKLRLASTVKNRSAQALVTQALDKFLAAIPEIEALAAQLKRK